MISLRCASSFFKFLILLVALFVTCQSRADLAVQSSDVGAPFVSNTDAKVYKAHTQNWTSLQDRRGVMYFGNSTGILEFDGQRWRTLATSGNPMVRALAMASDGTIFYGSNGDIGYLSVAENGEAKAVSIKDKIPKEEQLFNDVWQIESTSQGVYFLTRSRIFRFFEGKLTALAGKLASSQATVIDDTLIYADNEKGICLIDGDKIVPIPQLAGVFNGKRTMITRFGSHELLIGRLSGDFQLVDLSPLWDDVQKKYQILRTNNVSIKTLSTEISHLLNDEYLYLYKVLRVDADRFAISTVKGGIFILNREGKVLRTINKNSGLLDNTVAGIMLDRANNLWASTNSGISFVELAVPQSNFGVRHGIDGVSMSAAYHHGRFYIGTFQNVVMQVPFRYQQKQDVPQFQPLRNGTSEVWQFLIVGDDLMAASGRGLYRIDGEEGEHITGSSNNNYCLGTTPLLPDYLFVGLMGGVEVFKRDGGKWHVVGRLPGVKENIRRITTDMNGDLWLNTEVNGVIRAHFAGTNPMDVALHRMGLEHGLPDLVSSRTSFINSTLYLVTLKGLLKAKIAPWKDGDADQTRFVPEDRYGKEFSDGSREISEIISDRKGGVVIKSSDGVYWMKPNSDGTYQSNPQPFRGIVSIDDSVYTHPDGSVWLPGESLYRIELDMTKNYAQDFNVLIRKITVNNKQVVFDGTHGKTGKMMGSALTLFGTEQEKSGSPQLMFGQNALAFDFSATFYEKPGSTKFQYQLEGFDKDWSAWDGITSKEYTNIPEGKYRFRVRAKNIYDAMGNEAVYAFEILPPWYRTWWAYLIWITCAFSGVFVVVQLYTLRLKREKIYLEELVAERTQQLRDASLTDPLTGLRNRRFISEVLQNDIVAFVGYKNYVISSSNNREGLTGKEVFGLFLLDMDHFKQVNDTLGHDAGDQILKQFAEILSSLVRKDDVVVRLGGEEFLVVLKKTKPDYVHTFALKLLESVAEKHFDIGDGTTIRKTCSIGYTVFPSYSQCPEQLSFEHGVMLADLAMYYAKHNGRNRAVSVGEGDRLPEGDAVIRKVVTSLDFAIEEGYLKIGQVQTPSESSMS